MIDNVWLLSRLRKVALARALVTLGLFLPLAIGCLSLVPRKWLEEHEAIGAVVLFGIPGLFCWWMTHAYCRKAVVCPFCGGSLWDCGSGNFKPRRMRVVAGCCPRCETEIL